MITKLDQQLSQFKLIPAWLSSLPGRITHNLVYLKSAGVFDKGYTLLDVKQRKFLGTTLKTLEKALDELVEITEHEDERGKFFTFLFHFNNSAGMRVRTVILRDDTLESTETWKGGTMTRYIDKEGHLRGKRFFNSDDVMTMKTVINNQLCDLKEGTLTLVTTYDPETGDTKTSSSRLEFIEVEDGQPKKIKVVKTETDKDTIEYVFRVHQVNNARLGEIIIFNTREDGEKKQVVYLKDRRVVRNTTSLFKCVESRFFDGPNGELIPYECKMDGRTYRITYVPDGKGSYSKIRHSMTEDNKPKGDGERRTLFQVK